MQDVGRTCEKLVKAVKEERMTRLREASLQRKHFLFSFNKLKFYGFIFFYLFFYYLIFLYFFPFFLCDPIHDPICGPICDPVLDLVCDPVWSNRGFVGSPMRLSFCGG